VGHLLNVFHLVDLPVADKSTGKIDENSDIAWKWRSISMGVLFLLVLPFNLSKNLATLRYFSMFILAIVFFTISVSLVQSPEYYETFKGHDDYKINLLYRPFDIKWLQGLATMMLSFNC